MLTDWSAGRFVVCCDQDLTPLISTAGRVVTVVGGILSTYTDTVWEWDPQYWALWSW